MKDILYSILIGLTIISIILSMATILFGCIMLAILYPFTIGIIVFLGAAYLIGKDIYEDIK